MRNLRRNQREIEYQLYIPDATTDKYGNSIGSYSEKKKMRISLSPDTGKAINSSFGKEYDYERLMTYSGDCEINELSYVFVDGIQYIVNRKAVTMNETKYHLKRVVKA